MTINFSRDDGAVPPFHKYDSDAGWDLAANCDGLIIPPGETGNIPTGIRLEIPVGYYVRITGRSSTLRKHNLLVNEGIIDAGYTGEMFVSAKNMGTEPFVVECGMRLAQLIFAPVVPVQFNEIDRVKPVAGTRGNNGFGSTGR